MAKTKVKFILNDYEIKTDFINLTILMSFATLFLVQTFNISSVIYFLIDIPIVVMFWQNKSRIINACLSKPVFLITITLLVIFGFMLIGGIVNSVPLGNIIYGIYKYYRGFIFFYCTLALCDDNSIEHTYGFIKLSFAINVVLSIVEFFLFGINQDLLGGIFGTIIGVNQYTNLYFVIISVYCIEKILNRDVENKKNYKQIITMSIMMLAIAALAEIKYFFAEFLILFLIAYICLPKKLKSVIGMGVVLLSIVICYNILLQIFPEFSDLVRQLKLGGMVRLADLQRHYSTDYDIGRAVVFSYSNKNLLPAKINQIFGMGIGNVTSSNMVNNSFWIKNQLTHYDQFYTSYLYNEQGIIGFILYCLVFFEILLIGIKAVFQRNKRKYGTMLVMLVCGCIMIFAYNMALYSQLCFIAFWALAVLVKKCTQVEV